MCNFLSAIITPKGDILWHPMVDSHSQLVRLFKLKDDKPGRFVKVELTPGEHLLDVSKWTWTVDKFERPMWLDDVEKSAEKNLRSIAKGMLIVNEHRDLIVDGCWIVAGNSTVNEILAGRVISIGDSATINHVGGSATVKDVGDSATIKDVGGSATIKDVGNSATINYVGGSATINHVGDSATINHVGNSATINYVGDSATIKDVGDSATINYVGGSAKIKLDNR